MLRNNLRHDELMQLIKEIVKNELRNEFEFCKHHYVIASHHLIHFIQQEIESAFAINKLTPTQLAIINDPNNSLHQLARSITGSLRADLQFNIVLGSGFEPTGLMKIYFDCLNVRLRTFVNDLTFNTKVILEGLDYVGDRRHTTFPATKDTLHHSYNGYRKKPMLLTFCHALIEYATPAQITALAEEAKTPQEHTILKELATHSNPLRAWLPNPPDTKHFAAYQAALSEHMTNDNELSPRLSAD